MPHLNPIFIRMVFSFKSTTFPRLATGGADFVSPYNTNRLERGSSYLTLLSRPKDEAGDRGQNGAQ